MDRPGVYASIKYLIGPLPASRANVKGTIKFHSRPRVPWPQGIFSRSERINKRPDLPGGGWQLTFVNVEYFHKPPIGDAQLQLYEFSKPRKCNPCQPSEQCPVKQKIRGVRRLSGVISKQNKQDSPTAEIE